MEPELPGHRHYCTCLHLNSWNVKQDKTTVDDLRPHCVLRTICKENKKAIMMTTGLVTTGLKI